jgi:hypothetical protein
VISIAQFDQVSLIDTNMIKWYGGFVVSLMLSKQDEGDHEKQIKILI